MNISEQIDFSKLNGLIPAIAQDVSTGDVLMLGFMNREALDKTLSEKKATYFSRSRNCLWTKGESSGNIQRVRSIYFDCDLDTVLLKVEQVGGAACHKGYGSCFYREAVDDELTVIAEKVFDPKDVYNRNKK